MNAPVFVDTNVLVYRQDGSDPIKTRSLTIDYADEILPTLSMNPDEFSEDAKTLVAVKLHKLGRLSTGAAAELANLPKPLFLTRLAAYDIDTFDMSEDELRSDVASARRHL